MHMLEHMHTCERAHSTQYMCGIVYKLSARSGTKRPSIAHGTHARSDNMLTRCVRDVLKYTPQRSYGYVQINNRNIFKICLRTVHYIAYINLSKVLNYSLS